MKHIKQTPHIAKCTRLSDRTRPKHFCKTIKLNNHLISINYLHFLHIILFCYPQTRHKSLDHASFLHKNRRHSRAKGRENPAPLGFRRSGLINVANTPFILVRAAWSFYREPVSPSRHTTAGGGREPFGAAGTL